MTKTMKKSLIAVLVLVMAFACGMFAMSAPVAKADDTAVDFNSYVLTNLKNASGVYDETLFANHDYVQSVKEAQEMYATATDVSADAKEVYEKVIAVFTEPFKVETYATSTLFYRIMGIKPLLYSQNAELVEYEALYAEYNDGTHVDVANYFNTIANYNGGLGIGANFVEARAQMDAIKAKIDAAIVAIKGIEYEVAGAMVAGDTTGKIVLASETSVGWDFDATNKVGVEAQTGATAALDAIYGSSFAALTSEHATIVEADVDYYDVYKDATEALNVEYAKVVAVIDEIAAVDAALTYDTLYTNKTQVEDARDSYDALDSTANNNLQSLVSNYDVLTGLEADILAIEGLITAAITAIGEIPNPVVYTAACKTEIDEARAAVVALPADVEDEAVVATYVTNYATLTAAEDAYQAFQDEVDAAIAAIKGLKAYMEEGLYNAFLATETLYKALDNGDQKATVDATAVVAADLPAEAPATIDNCSKLYVYYQALANEIWANVQPVITAINQLGEVTITEEYIDAVDKAREMYDALDELQEQPLVSNIDKLVAIEAALELALTDVEKWEAAVEAIDEDGAGNVVITVDNWGEVATAENIYNPLETGVKAIITGTAKYAESWAKYQAATAARDALVQKIKDIAEAMRDLDTNAIEINDQFEANVTAFDTAVTAVKADYDDLANIAGAQQYLADTYVDYKANYDAALVNYDQYHVEALIVKIGKIENITIASVGAIEAAEDAYETLIAKNASAIVRNYNDTAMNPNLVGARARLDEIAAELNAWIAEVEAIAADLTAVDALVSVDLANVVALNEQYKGLVTGDVYTFNKTTGAYETTGVNLEDAAVVTYLADAKAILVAAEAKAFTLITELTVELRAIVAAAGVPGFEPSADFITRLENAENAYVALADSQKNEEYNLVNGAVVAPAVEEITDLLDAYGAFAEVYRYQKLVTDYAAAVDSLYSTTVDGWDQYVSENVPVMISTLKSIYEFSGEYQAVLQPSYDKLIEVETWVEENWANNEQWSEDPFNPVVTLEDYIAKQINDLNTILNGDRFAGIPGLVGQMQELVGFDYVVDDMGTAFPWDDVTEHVDGTIDVINAQIAEMEGKITALEDFAQATGDNVMQLTQGLRQQILALDELKAAYEAKVATIEGALDAVTQDIFNLTQGLTQYKGEVAGKFESVEGALDVVTSDIRGIIEGINQYKGQVAGQFSDVEDALDIITTDIRNITEGITQFKGEVAAMKADLESKIAALEKAIEDEETARKEADTAINNKVDANKTEIEDLLAAQVKKLNTTITIITVIFSVVMAGMIACTVILFLKRR